jgi:TPP-dependent indolepyruvate ferredoxin oxidoreductase alpha subunit
LINLSTNTAKLQAFLDAAVTTTGVSAVVSYTEMPGDQQITQTKTIDGTEAIDICTVPKYNGIRKVETIQIVNLDSVACTITIRYTEANLFKNKNSLVNSL